MATKTEIREALEALESLEQVGRRLEKEEILKEVSGNEVFKTLVRMAIGPDRYHIKPSERVKTTTAKKPKVVASYSRFLKLSESLKAREWGSKEAEKRVTRFLKRCYPVPQKWFARVLNKNLRIGVGAKTLGAVWGAQEQMLGDDDRIVFKKNKCVLAEKLEDLQKKKSWGGIEFGEWGWMSEPKLDGDRALLFWFPEDEELVVLTRGGKRWTHLEQCETLVNRVRRLHKKVAPCTGFGILTPMLYDGEFIAKSGSWNETASIVRSRVKFDEAKFKSNIRVLLWDWCPLGFFNDGVFPLELKERKYALMKAAGLKKVTMKLTKIVVGIYVVGHRMVYSMDEVWADNKRKLARGFEGTMVKNPMSHMVMKRSSDVIKIKPRDSDTGTILKCVSGKGKHARSTDKDIKKVWKWLNSIVGDVDVTDDGYYFHCDCGEANVEDITNTLKRKVNDSNDRRISCHRDEDTVSYRYSERLGYFVVKVDSTGKKLRVGGKMTHQAGRDQRMEFWQRRKELIGVKVDFKYQAGRDDVANASFNTFDRLREDL